MAYNFSQFKTAADEVSEWLRKEYQSIHTGRATPAVLDRIRVDSYGTAQEISHVANISVEDPRTLLISPWDKEILTQIEAGIRESGLGLGLSTTDGGVRVTFPELTGEKREILKKLVREKLEEARVSIRKAREEIWEEIQEKQKAGEITEDEKFTAKNDLQELVDEANKKLEERADAKEEEISK